MKRYLFLFLFVFSINCSSHAQTKTVSGSYSLAADYSRQYRGLSVLVMKGDKVVFEEYQNGHSADTPWMLASGTKSFSGEMLAAAIEDKLVKSFDEKVSDTITEWKNDPRKSKITIRQLLSLTGGIDAGAVGRPPSYSESIKFSAKFEPGEKFEYGPVPFQVFGELMRRKLEPKRESVLNYLKRRVLDPIGLKAANWTMQSGQPNLPSGAFLTAREWIKFGHFLKNGGKLNGKQLIKMKLLDELYVGSKANPNYGITFWLNRSNSGKADVSENVGRLQQLLGERESETTEISRNGVGNDVAKDLYMAAGAGKQRLYVMPSLDLVIVRQGRQSQFDDREFLTRLINGTAGR
ncbi:MAG: serine hydrolase domain-containing protein [Blastocatellia bacterium]